MHTTSTFFHQLGAAWIGRTVQANIIQELYRTIRVTFICNSSSHKASKRQEGAQRQIKSFMNNLGKLITKIGLISLLSVLPLTAQVGNGVKFTAPFPFYVGDKQ